MKTWDTGKSVVMSCGLVGRRTHTILIDPTVYAYGIALGMACSTHENGFFLLGDQIDEYTWFIVDLAQPRCLVSASTWKNLEDRECLGTWHTHPFDVSAGPAFSSTDKSDDGVVHNYDVSILSNAIGVVVGVVRMTLDCGSYYVAGATVCPYDPERFQRFLSIQGEKTSRSAGSGVQQARWNLSQPAPATWKAEPEEEPHLPGRLFIGGESTSEYIARLKLSVNDLVIIRAQEYTVQELQDEGYTREHLVELGILIDAYWNTPAAGGPIA